MIKEILLDMDGVLADFYTSSTLAHKEAARRVLGIKSAKDMDDRFPHNEWNIPDVLGLTTSEFWAPIDNYDFWINVPMYQGAREFVAELRELAPVTLCTSSSLSPHCAKAKIEWIARHIGSDVPMFIGYKASKALLAKPENLLIDDYVRNIDGFAKAGGEVLLVPRPWNEAKQPLTRTVTDGLSFLSVDYDSMIDEVAQRVL
jgi:beta-phosphoglucomutase-like phosphatase (HAD superfamily)